MDLRQELIDWAAGFEPGKLEQLGPLEAVIQCAFDVKLIDKVSFEKMKLILIGTRREKDGNDLEKAGVEAPEADLEAAYNLNFETFVPPDAPLVESPYVAKEVPLGAFLAFIAVDRPAEGSTMGRRHLVHPMLSLGGGSAVGLGNLAVSSVSKHDGWEVLDLSEALSWVPLQNAGDTISVMPSGVQHSRLIRLRYRVPATIQEGLASVWGHPQPSRELFDSVVSIGGDQRVVLVEEGYKDQPYEGFFRPTIRFTLTKIQYEEFFNSPNEMRGQYYVNADNGDTYTHRVLSAIVDRIDWNRVTYKQFANPKELATLPQEELKERLRYSLKQGKIWTAESGKKSVSWSETQPYPPNERWPKFGANPDDIRSQYTKIKDEFFSEIPQVNESDKEAIIHYLGYNGSGLYESGAYWEVTNEGHPHPYDPSSAPKLYNVDCKGVWINAGGDVKSPSGRKYGRGYQIKWFGWT